MDAAGADPFAVEPAPQRRSRARAWAWCIPVAALGSFGPVVVVLKHGDPGRRGAGWLAILALSVAAGLVGLNRRHERFDRTVVLGAVVGSAVAGWMATGEVGKAPVVLVVAGTAVAAAAMGRIPAAPVRRPSPGAVLLLMTGWFTWSRLSVIPITVASLAASLAWARAATSRHPLARTVDHRIVAMAMSLAQWVAIVVVFVVSVPLLYLPAAVVAVARRLRPRSAGEGWRERSVPDQAVRRDSTRPFLATDPHAARRRLASSLAVAVGGVAVIGVLVWVPRHGSPTEPSAQVNLLSRVDSQPYSAQPAFEGVPFADDLQAEQQRLAPDMEGRYTNSVGGERRTLQPEPCPCQPVVVWLLGGSAAFGIGQRDLHTIPSELVQLAGRDGRAVEVVNLARPGWTSHDERKEVERRLESGEAAPDVVVFYDGFNDAVAAVVDTALGVSDPQSPPELVAERVARYNEHPRSLASAGGPQVVGAEAAKKYRSERDAVEALLRPEGTQVVRVFQPDAFAAPPQLAVFAQMVGLPIAEVEDSDVSRTLEAMAAELGDEVVDLRDLFAQETRPVFFGTVHTNELGAELSAQAVYRVLRPLLPPS